MSEIKRVAFSTIDSNAVGGSNISAAGSSDSAASKKLFPDFNTCRAGLSSTGAKNCTTSDGLTTQKSISLLTSSTTAGLSAVNEGATKNIRLSLELFASNSNSFPEFNFSKLLYLEKKKQKKLKQKSNGFVIPFDDNDDEVTRIAKELERKYGSSYASGRGKGKRDDHCDIGLGYDESDSFIDNTEAYDEVIPEEVETVEGGFYINSGALEFKKLSNYEKTDEIIKMPKKARKRTLPSSSDESSTSDEDVSNKETPAEGPSEKRHKTLGNDNKDQLGDHEKQNDKSDAMHGGSKSESCSNSPKQNADIGSDVENEKSSLKNIKTTTVKDMLKAKRDNFLKMQGSDLIVSSKTAGNGEVKGSLNTTDDESSGNDSDSTHITSDSNKDPTRKKFETLNVGDESSEKHRSTDTKLPDLSKELYSHIQEMKNTAQKNNLIGKKFQFDDKLTQMFLRIDESCLCLEKPIRNMIFAHLEYQLSLPKYYFLRKAKQLRVKDEKSKTKRALIKLRKAVDEIMPIALGNYDLEMRKYTEYQSNSNNLTVLQVETAPKLPKRKFPWTEAVRNLLYDVYQVRWVSYSILRTKKQSFEDFINMYLKEKVVGIWPNGWMKYEELQKEVEKRKNIKKSKDIVKISLTGESVYNQYAPSALELGNQEEGNDLRFTVTSDSELYNDGCKNQKNKTRQCGSKSYLFSQNNSDVGSRDLVQQEHTSNQNNNNTSKSQQFVVDLMSPTRRTDHSIHSIMSSPSSTSSSTSTTPQPMQCMQQQQQQQQQVQHSNKGATPTTKTNSLGNQQNFNSVTDAGNIYNSHSASFNSNDQCENSISIETHLPRRDSSSESDGVEIVGVFPASKKTISVNKNKYKKSSNNSNQHSRSNTPNIVCTTSSAAVASKNKTSLGKLKNSKKPTNNKSFTESNSADFDVSKVVKVLKELEQLQQQCTIPIPKGIDQ